MTVEIIEGDCRTVMDGMPKESVNCAIFSPPYFGLRNYEMDGQMVLAGCPPGGTVLDPFSGAGTTAMVAQGLERNAIGIELNPKYVAMARERISGKHGVFAEVEW